ncbi:terminase family protein [Pseudomonas sp. CCI4.2]|uniref:terminase large subunit domain-containing protein n=1 Tax=Pseudomonas sp. CCI4.2 TaxID=3048620 RepID=UPI002AC8FC90|nr:terminase family protein [Pseudomonas sp. CCI4.2]MEB0090058.1 terminase family protein [Pseudomonas sp. CCI4.2]WPX53478.1 terminase family protein [Pseudomonas sp. CCI4.2]
MPYAPEVKDAAKRLYLRRYKPREIQAQLHLPNIRIVYYWIAKGGWDDLLTDEEPLSAVSRRITLILEKKEGLAKVDLDELDRLIQVRGRLQTQTAKPAPRPADDLEPPPVSQQRRDHADRTRRHDRDTQKKEKKKTLKNDISHLTEVDFLEKFVSRLFGYQKELFAAKQNPLTRRIRNVLKARQTGLTYYFAGEAFMDAVLTADNQMFLSASRAQSEIFRNYIIKFAREWFGLELTGNPIILSNGAELRFLSTNSSTAQGHHGHVYVDEYFWIRDFEKLNTLSGAMATHKKWRKTYFSTPSAVSHQAYPFWTGDTFRRGKHKAASQSFPSAEELRRGTLCPDGQWRKVITIHDAIAGGCDLFDLEQLRLENSDDQFNQLYLCQFIDSTQSAFNLADLEKCYSDLTLWTDYNSDPKCDQPFGNAPVWIGYDPSRTRDDASCVVVAPPLEPGGKFRILEKHSWRGHSFTYQAAQVKKLTERFNVQHIGIDITGVGYGVFDLVRDFYARATPIHYSLETKNTLVLKAQDTIQGRRIEWDADWNDIASAFLTIKRGATGSGQITYSASRTDATGHADVAWAVMHALANEPLNIHKKRKSRWSTVEGTHARSHAGQSGESGSSGLRAQRQKPKDAGLQFWNARVGADQQHGRLPRRVRQRRRADLHPTGVADRSGQAAAGQRAPRHHPPVQAQPAAA